MKDKRAKEMEVNVVWRWGCKVSVHLVMKGLNVRPTALEVLWGNREPQKDGSS